MTALNSKTLPHLGEHVPVPAYDRDTITAGIVHFGVGGFHRAHEAMYLDRLMNQGKAQQRVGQFNDAMARRLDRTGLDMPATSSSADLADSLT